MYFSEINKMFIIFVLCLDSLQLHEFYEYPKLKAIVINTELNYLARVSFVHSFSVSRWVFWFTIFISKESQSILTSV